MYQPAQYMYFKYKCNKSRSAEIRPYIILLYIV